MQNQWFKALIAGAVMISAILLTTFLLKDTSSSSESSRAGSDNSSAKKDTSDKDKSDAARSNATSGIWQVGDKWVVKVRQDSASISPDSSSSVALIPFRFKVTAAPAADAKPDDALWTVTVKQDGAQGPYADGWRLFYEQTKSDHMRLKKVSAGEQEPIDATVASIVLGTNFPYELTYKNKPKNKTVDSAKLTARTIDLPAAELDKQLGKPKPGKKSESQGSAEGGLPPSDAPILGPGEVPPGVPAE